MNGQIVDPAAMVRPLLDAQPGSHAVCTCYRCEGRIEGLARLDDHGFFVHPDQCPPQETHDGEER